MKELGSTLAFIVLCFALGLSYDPAGLGRAIHTFVVAVQGIKP